MQACAPRLRGPGAELPVGLCDTASQPVHSASHGRCSAGCSRRTRGQKSEDREQRGPVGTPVLVSGKRARSTWPRVYPQHAAPHPAPGKNRDTARDRQGRITPQLHEPQSRTTSDQPHREVLENQEAHKATERQGLCGPDSGGRTRLQCRTVLALGLQVSPRGPEDRSQGSSVPVGPPAQELAHQPWRACPHVRASPSTPDPSYVPSLRGPPDKPLCPPCSSLGPLRSAKPRAPLLKDFGKNVLK